MEEAEALRLKSTAESKYKASNLKSALKYAKRAHRLSPNLDGVATMVTALEILRTAHKSSPNPNWYKILQVEPFTHINTIRTKYKKLAFLLHPDKNPHLGSDEAFKLVVEAFRFLSDRIRRKEFDMKLRVKIQDRKMKESSEGLGLGETFWTACSTCRLLHQFERRYLGQSLVCPSCRKSFEAVEVESGDNAANAGVRSSERLRKLASSGVGESRRRLRKRMSSVGEVMERSEPKKAKVDEEMMTLAEFKQKAREQKMKEKGKGKNAEVEKRAVAKKAKDLGVGNSRKSKQAESEDLESTAKYLGSSKSRKSNRAESEDESKKAKDLGSAKSRKSKRAESEDLEGEDAQFYDFNKDKRSFKKGQVWAIYDEGDGMPRNYGLVDEVVSVSPFEVKISWLDLQNNGDQWLASWEKMGLHVPCGRFKVARQTITNSVHIFSHVVDCDRAAREVYRIYPKKGSVWAVYNEATFESDGSNLLVKEKLCYDIVVFLTSYSEMHGLSMGYLEKVDGFNTVFKRREIGAHAIRCLEKDDVRFISHEIPAKKLSGTEAPNLPKDCWELDPASLPLDLLTFG
ncbi:PREDICTED: uncharacterized protein LOC101291837 [Fragaria vesca subsp. vesca]|uniref:uncharacterized protein LOC101291837 n=1 Tax=Fragaria vesca subsp. vesca TaxID=101020 RepID=UPI0002C352C4|nr:PREDICTED: uncharacterized protein LOC101291837 [Fragaria vesca subsp. vesca]